MRAGEYETESPTASLLAHNLLCFCAAQWSWKVFFSDISAAFLQGDYLPAERRVFVQTPKNYPLFVRRFLQSKIPAGARTDLFRMKKAGFGLAESPRLWYHRFKRGAESIGGREMKLCPGVFSFLDQIPNFELFWQFMWMMCVSLHILISNRQCMRSSMHCSVLENGNILMTGQSSVDAMRNSWRMALS